MWCDRCSGTRCVQGDVVFGHALCFFGNSPRYWQLPKVLILQSASARAGADRTFSDQQLGRVTGEEENRNIGLERHRMLATVILVFYFVCTLASG